MGAVRDAETWTPRSRRSRGCQPVVGAARATGEPKHERRAGSKARPGPEAEPDLLRLSLSLPLVADHPRSGIEALNEGLFGGPVPACGDAAARSPLPSPVAACK